MKRQKRSPDFKRKVAIEALKERETINKIASRYGIHLVQISQWKRHLCLQQMLLNEEKQRSCEKKKKNGNN